MKVKKWKSKKIKASISQNCHFGGSAWGDHHEVKKMDFGNFFQWMGFGSFLKTKRFGSIRSIENFEKFIARSEKKWSEKRSKIIVHSKNATEHQNSSSSVLRFSMGKSQPSTEWKFTGITPSIENRFLKLRFWFWEVTFWPPQEVGRRADFQKNQCYDSCGADRGIFFLKKSKITVAWVRWFPGNPVSATRPETRFLILCIVQVSDIERSGKNDEK